MRDFAPISMLADSTFVLVVHPSLPAKSVKELVAFAKAHPDRLNAAVPGLATPPHLLTELFRFRTGIKITIVPYKGGAPAAVDLMAGQIEMAFVNLPSVLNFVKAGRLRAIAMANAKRSELLPAIPTTAEAGFPGIVASPWMSLMAPAGTPREILARLNAETVKIMSSPEAKEALNRQGANPLWSTPEETQAFIRDEIAKWGKVVKEASIKIE
jgi:tripartite-type tricarboxylate transporter receptor subunit TctC